MNRLLARFMVILIPAFLLFVPLNLTYAHSGRTDDSGGHNCYVGSCAGTYHYHNGGSGGPTVSPPDYVSQGVTNGKAHAERDVEAIKARTMKAGYQAGRSDGLADEPRSSFVPVPDTICNITFTFEEGTNDTYKSWYHSAYRSACGETARTVHQDSYDYGYGEGLKSQEVDSIPVNEDTGASSDSDGSSDSSRDDLVVWAILGGLASLPFVAPAVSGIKSWWNK